MSNYDLTPENLARWRAELEQHTKGLDPFVPTNFDEYIGQKKAKRIVLIAVDAALKEHRALPNTLITGPYGQGKTSLARLMADRFDSNIPLIDASSINRSPPTEGTIIIDEIHNLLPELCDSFNIAIDAGKIHILGCSTNPGALPPAFRSRFRQVFLEPYTSKEIEQILTNILRRKNTRAEPKSLSEIAVRSRFNPRVAQNYLSFILDIATLKNSSVTAGIVKEAFNELGVDKYGFLARDYAYIGALPTDGRPVGLQYISARISIDPETIEQELEPYLMQMGLIDRTPKGRVRVPEIVKKFA